jgi:hypothetical protein
VFGYREVHAENPIAEVWRYLRVCTNEGVVTELIQSLHHPDRKHERNVRKQARQLGYCVRQAEDYFEAARSVGLSTKPNLLYYGAMCLARSLTLLRLDGAHSLDYLRDRGRHLHHGLDLDRGNLEHAWRDGAVESALRSLRSRLFIKDDEGWGTFTLFYRSVQRSVSIVPCEIFIEGPGKINHVGRTNDPEMPAETELHPPFLFETLDLMRQLPDLYDDLRIHGVASRLCPGVVKETDHAYVSSWQDYMHKSDFRVKVQYEFVVKTQDAQALERVKSLYEKKNPEIRFRESVASNSVFQLSWEQTANESHEYWSPDIIQDISGGTYFLTDSSVYLPEPCAYLAVLFNLGMLARYYPDIWMRAIDSRSQVVNLVQSFLETAERKFPNLILDQLSGTRFRFHA